MVESILLCGLRVDLEISVEILKNYFVLGLLLGQIQKLCEIVSQKSLYNVHPSEICRNLMVLPQNFISCFRMLNFMMFWWLSIFSRSILVNFRLNWCPQKLLFEISLFLVANANFFYSTWLILLKFIKFHLFLSKTFQFEWKKFKLPCEVVANIGVTKREVWHFAAQCFEGAHQHINAPTDFDENGLDGKVIL